LRLQDCGFESSDIREREDEAATDFTDFTELDFVLIREIRGSFCF
jgi:hypothetical protein